MHIKFKQFFRRISRKTIILIGFATFLVFFILFSIFGKPVMNKLTQKVKKDQSEVNQVSQEVQFLKSQASMINSLSDSADLLLKN